MVVPPLSQRNTPRINTRKNDTKKAVQPMEPWTEETDMTGVSIGDEDQPPRVGGMIAHDPKNPVDRWYINPDFFLANYVEV